MLQGKILILSTDLNIGGAQAVAANIARYAPEHLHLTYLVFREQPGDYEEGITARGHRILHWPSPSENLPRFFLQLLRLLRRERFDVVHCHTMFNCGPVMLAAKLAGIPGRISHSHTTKEERREHPLRRLYRHAMRTLIHMCGNEYWACGREAGRVLYGKDWFDARGTIIPNGIDSAAFRFSSEHRAEVRQLYNLTDRFVIGHLGHYAEVKNQRFLIGLMPHILALQPNAVLLLFGEGPDRQLLAQTIEEMGLTGSVRLMGNVTGVGRILSAFDVFAFPSLFEGTPLALIEAQSNGLPCIISDRITADAIVSELVTALPIEGCTNAWVHFLTSARRPVDPAAVQTNYPDVLASMSLIYRGYETYIQDR